MGAPNYHPENDSQRTDRPQGPQKPPRLLGIFMCACRPEAACACRAPAVTTLLQRLYGR